MATRLVASILGKSPTRPPDEDNYALTFPSSNVETLNMSKFIVVLTGGIGSGKSLAASFFMDRGITIVEQDDVAREVVEPGEPALESIRQRFGEDVIRSDGTLDRAELRQRVFNDVDKRRWLQRLLHPLIGTRTFEHLHRANSRYAIVVNPLFRARSPAYDRVLVVDVPVDTQLNRTMARDNISLDLAQSMVNSQITREQRLALADDVIKNDGEIEHVEQSVDRLHRRYLVMAHVWRSPIDRPLSAMQDTVPLVHAESVSTILLETLSTD